jgi:hypothetical protein
MNCTYQDIGKLIGGYELGLLTDEEKREFENHLLECEYCFQSLYRTAPLVKMMREGNIAPSRKIELSPEDRSERFTGFLRKSSIIQGFRRPWIFATAGIVAVVVLAVFLSVLFQRQSREDIRLRGPDEVSILVVSPVGGVSALSEIQWKAISGIISYRVKIFSKTGGLLWETSGQGNSVAVPDSINAILIPGQEYFWQVEAKIPEGDDLTSGKILFWIKD